MGENGDATKSVVSLLSSGIRWTDMIPSAGHDGTEAPKKAADTGASLVRVDFELFPGSVMIRTKP